MRKLLPVILSVMLLLLLPCCAAAEESTTVFLYMCGSDLQEECERDLEELCSLDLPENIEILALVGGSEDWDDRRLDADGLNRFVIRDGQYRDYELLDWASMGDAQTLYDFLDYGLSNYGADRNIAVLWNHGLAGAGGICVDVTAGDDYLAMDELALAFGTIYEDYGEFSFDMAVFDACLMGSFETALQMVDYADYMVASEELVSGIGLAYDSWVQALIDDPGISMEELGQVIADSYCAAALEEIPGDAVGMSVCYLPQFWDVHEQVENLGAALSAALEEGRLAEISRARQGMYAFGEYFDSSSDMVDLAAFARACQDIAPDAADALLKEIDECVVYETASSMPGEHSGLSILMPLSLLDEADLYLSDYDYYEFSPNYAAFLRSYAEAMNGSDYIFSPAPPSQMDAQEMAGNSFLQQVMDFFAVQAAPQATGIPEEEYGDESAGVPQFGEGENIYGFSMSLNAGDMQHLSYVEGMLLLEVEDGADSLMIDLGYMQDSWIDWEGGMVYSLFDGSWPVLEDQLITIYDQAVNKQMRRSIIPALVNGESCYLVAVFEGPDAIEGRIIGYNEGYAENGMPSRSLHALEIGDSIYPLSPVYYWDEWDELQEFEIEGDEIIYDGELTLEYQYIAGLDDEELQYLYCFCLNDIFGGYQMSDFIEFD